MTFYSAQALRQLSAAPLLHMDMLESMRRGQARLLDITDRSVLLRDLPSGALMLSAVDGESTRRAILAAPRPRLLVLHQPYLLDAIQAEFSLTRRMVCRQAVYASRTPLPLPPGADIRPLSLSALPFVTAHYAADAAYLRERLETGAMFGAFRNGRPIGFIGTHAEGSIGLLTVLPGFRRQGVATALESFLIDRMLEKGYTPFAQVVETNEPSLALQRRLGLSLSAETVCWLSDDPPEASARPDGAQA